MKNLFLFLILLLSLTARAATVTGPITGISGAESRRVEFHPQSTPFISGTNLVIGEYKALQIRDGTFSTSLVEGRYLVKFPPTTNTVTIWVPNTTNTYSIWQLTTNVFVVLNSADVSSGSGVNVTGAQLAATTTNADVVTVSVPTNGVLSVIQQNAAAVAATNNAAGATNQYGSIWLWRGGSATNYASITQAVAVATSGDVLELGAGYYLLTNRLLLPTNFTIRGAGAATVIANGYTNFINVGNSTPLIPLRDNLILENFSTTNIYPNRYQCFVGSFAVDGDVCFTNALIRNVTGTHNVDWYYVLQTNNCSIKFENVHIRSNWDIWFVDNTSGWVSNIVVNSSFTVTGPNVLNASAKARAMLVGRGCSVDAYNSSWVAVESGSTGLLLINSLAQVRMYNSTVLGVGGTNVYNQFGTTSDVFFYGAYPSLEKSVGSALTIGAPPWDAFEIENQALLATNILAPLNTDLVFKSGDEFSPADTTMDVSGNWTFPGSVTASSFVGPHTGNGAGITNIPASAITIATNAWSVNTALGLGTNYYFSGNTASCGITGIVGIPADSAKYAELTIKATGDITFTNPVAIYTSDMVDTRTITNGNTACIAVTVQPGFFTNLAIVQFK